MKLSANDIIRNLKAEVTSEGIPFMDGRQLGQLTVGEVVTVCDYGFINGDDGEYCVFIVKEDDKNFYCGGMILTNLFKSLDQYTDEEIREVLEQGIKITTEKAKSKKGRTYTKVTIL